MDNNIVVNSISYYDKNLEKYGYLFKNTKYVNFPPDDKNIKGDITRRKISFYNKNKKEIFSSRYEIIGVYENITHTWTWGWAIPKFKKNVTYMSRKILNYGLDIDSDETNSMFLKTELITGRFRISDHVQLDIHASIASYISKYPVVYKFVFDRSKSDSMKNYVEVGDNNVLKGDYSIYYLFILDYDKEKL
jgi:hypothetical protein